MSMRTVWEQDGRRRSVTAPLSLVVSAFAPVTDVGQTLTPELRPGDTTLLLVDLGRGKNRLGGSCLAQVYGHLGETPPDLDEPRDLVSFFAAVQALRGQLLAYHDRSDGGLIVTVLEMAFAGGCGLEIDGQDLAALFAEEPGAVLQIATSRLEAVRAILRAYGLDEVTRVVGRPVAGERVVVRAGGRVVIDRSRAELRALWSETTLAMATLRDDPGCAAEEQESRLDGTSPGLSAEVPFDPADDVAAPFIARGARPRVAILREQGVNGQVEMAAAFHRAGFETVDVHMSDVLSGRITLDGFRGLAACGGFSYGDVLGAGEGWAKSILLNGRARDQLAAYFARPDAFALGVCNGCQMMSNLRELIPGAARWPRFVRNRSEQFEARLSLVRVEQSPSILLAGMAGARLPIAVAHGEGRMEPLAAGDLEALEGSSLVAARFVDHHGRPTEHYPENPNGSRGGATALTTPDGRVTILMPHPERVFRTVQHSWHPGTWKEDGPWMRLFRNARVWVN